MITAKVIRPDARSLHIELRARNKEDRKLLRRIVDEKFEPTGGFDVSTVPNEDYSSNVDSVNLHFNFYDMSG